MPISVEFSSKERATHGAIRLNSVSDETGSDITNPFISWCSENGLDIRTTQGLLTAVDQYSLWHPGQSP